MKLIAFDGRCPQLKRGQELIDLLELENEYEGYKVKEFCFQDGFDGTIKISVSLKGFVNKDEIWDKVFRKDIPAGFEDFFDEETGNDYFYGMFREKLA